MKAILGRVARDFGTPCFVYFVDQVRDRVEQLRSFFGDRFLISYAVKCNPNLDLLRTLRGVVDMLDVSSAGEVTRALEAGWMAAELSFTGPGKRETELQTSVEAGVGEIIVESVDEADLLNRIAARVGRKQRILVRLGPARVPRGFGLNMSGKPSQFGVDEEEIDAGLDKMQEMAHLDLCGFHIYSGTQCLDAEAISENYEIFIDLFQRVCSAHGIQPQRLIFGSGIGIPYFDTDAAVDLGAVAERINPALDELKSTAAFSATELILETGRFLVGEAGVYITRVIRKKCSRGIEICICDGGMNHHMAAAGHLGVVPRNYRMLKITGSDEGPERVYNIVGPLCTTIDTLGRQVKFKGLEAGDVIGIRSSGAYGLTVSPIQFISHPPPREILVETVEGRIVTQEGSEPDGMGPAAASQRAIQLKARFRAEGIIILGVPRSGTTLLRRLIDAHPKIACPGETNIFGSCGRFLRSGRIAEGVQIGVVEGLGYAGFSKVEVLARLREFAFSFHRDYAQQHGKPRWGSKTAFDAFYLEEIEQLCGEHVHFVCIQRHGLDVACSIQELCQKNGGYLSELHEYVVRYPMMLEAFAHAWVDLTQSIHAFAQRHPQNAILVSYEDLTEQTDATMARIMEFVGEQWSPNLLGQALEKRSEIGLGDWKTYGRNAVDRSSINRWKGVSRDTVSRLGAICNPTLRLCGYEPVKVQKERGDDETRRRYEIGLLLQGLGKKTGGKGGSKNGS